MNRWNSSFHSFLDPAIYTISPRTLESQFFTRPSMKKRRRRIHEVIRIGNNWSKSPLLEFPSPLEKELTLLFSFYFERRNYNSPRKTRPITFHEIFSRKTRLRKIRSERNIFIYIRSDDISISIRVEGKSLNAWDDDSFEFDEESISSQWIVAALTMRHVITLR